MVKGLSTALTLLLLPMGLACDDGSIQMNRPDSGAPLRDMGVSGPLQLTPGMSFSYNAFLTFREAQGLERNATYTLSYTIDAVDDQGLDAESSITISAMGSNTLSDDWDPTTDFDSWVARLGPALSTDQLSPGASTVPLEQLPELPPAPTPKMLPRPGVFFMDVRKVSDIKVGFSQMYEGKSPQVADPDDNGGTFLFSYEGPEDSYGFNYSAGTVRTIRLQYDPRGFLTTMDEQIGESGSFPSLTARITLNSGP